MLIPQIMADRIRRRSAKLFPDNTRFAAADKFTGRVISCPDGDGLTMDVSGKIIQVRLWGMDAPEWGQPYARQSWHHLNSLIWGKPVTCFVKERDRYSRLVCECFGLSDYSMNLLQVLYGFAWYCPRYAPHATHYRDAQRLARMYERGLWRNPNPCPPWQFRHSKKT